MKFFLFILNNRHAKYKIHPSYFVKHQIYKIISLSKTFSDFYITGVGLKQTTLISLEKHTKNILL